MQKRQRFFQRQIKELRLGGVPVLFGKCGIILGLPFALLIVLLVRLLEAFILIRFIPLTSSRIGHFSSETEMYLCKRDTEHRNGRYRWDIFYCVPPVSNQYLKKMWKRVLCIYDFAYWLDKINAKIPGANIHRIPMPSYRDTHNLFKAAEPHLSFTAKEEEFGQQALRKIGIADNAPFICFHARDSIYLNSALSSGNWNYHNFRDSNIHNYMPAAEELSRRGYFLVRMGAIVKEQLNNSNHRIIDYATRYRSDFLDIYLSSMCKFFISSLTGIAEVAEVFHKPIVWVNCVPIEHIHSWDANDLIITKKLWLRSEKRFLTFREILGSEIGRFWQNKQYEELGIEVLENTPEEIMAVAVEMDERLNGRWRATVEDEELQRRFWSFLRPSELHGEIKARIGTDFLQKNQELLN